MDRSLQPHISLGYGSTQCVRHSHSSISCGDADNFRDRVKRSANIYIPDGKRVYYANFRVHVFTAAGQLVSKQVNRSTGSTIKAIAQVIANDMKRDCETQCIIAGRSRIPAAFEFRKRVEGEVAGTFQLLAAARVQFQATTDNLAKTHSYAAVPAATLQASRSGLGLPQKSGVYFVWASGIVVYVGQSRNLRNRARVGHECITEGDSLSWLEIEPGELNFSEAFYIGALRPARNYGCYANR